MLFGHNIIITDNKGYTVGFGVTKTGELDDKSFQNVIIGAQGKVSIITRRNWWICLGLSDYGGRSGISLGEEIQIWVKTSTNWSLWCQITTWIRKLLFIWVTRSPVKILVVSNTNGVLSYLKVKLIVSHALGLTIRRRIPGRGGRRCGSAAVPFKEIRTCQE